MLFPSTDRVVLETISMEKAVLELLEGDIIKIRFCENIEMNLGDMKRLQELKSQLAGESEYYQLLDASGYAGVTKEAREFSATPAANNGSLAKAVVTQNLAMRLIINFFISVNKPPVPHRVFSNETDALEWIDELKMQRRKKTERSDAN